MPTSDGSAAWMKPPRVVFCFVISTSSTRTDPRTSTLRSVPVRPGARATSTDEPSRKRVGTSARVSIVHTGTVARPTPSSRTLVIVPEQAPRPASTARGDALAVSVKERVLAALGGVLVREEARRGAAARADRSRGRGRRVSPRGASTSAARHLLLVLVLRERRELLERGRGRPRVSLELIPRAHGERPSTAHLVLDDLADRLRCSEVVRDRHCDARRSTRRRGLEGLALERGVEGRCRRRRPRRLGGARGAGRAVARGREPREHEAQVLEAHVFGGDRPRLSQRAGRVEHGQGLRGAVRLSKEPAAEAPQAVHRLALGRRAPSAPARSGTRGSGTSRRARRPASRAARATGRSPDLRTRGARSARGGPARARGPSRARRRARRGSGTDATARLAVGRAPRRWPTARSPPPCARPRRRSRRGARCAATGGSRPSGAARRGGTRGGGSTASKSFIGSTSITSIEAGEAGARGPPRRGWQASNVSPQQRLGAKQGDLARERRDVGAEHRRVARRRGPRSTHRPPAGRTTRSPLRTRVAARATRATGSSHGALREVRRGHGGEARPPVLGAAGLPAEVFGPAHRREVRGRLREHEEAPVVDGEVAGEPQRVDRAAQRVDVEPSLRPRARELRAVRVSAAIGVHLHLADVEPHARTLVREAHGDEVRGEHAVREQRRARGASSRARSPARGPRRARTSSRVRASPRSTAAKASALASRSASGPPCARSRRSMAPPCRAGITSAWASSSRNAEGS